MSGGAKVLVGVGGAVLIGLSLLIGSIFFNAPEVQFAESDKTPATLSPTTNNKATPEVKSETVQQDKPQQNTPTLYQPTPVSDGDKAAMQRAEAEIAAQQEKVHQSQCESLELGYEAGVLNEEARHRKALDAIDADWLGRGMGYSGGYQAAKDQENAKYQVNIQALENQLVANIIAYGCS